MPINSREHLRPKSRWELIRLSAAVMGIELAYAAETAFVSPTFLQIGVPKHLVTLLWGLSPLIGFFLTPLLGSLSDQCTWRMGRRRPFILITAIGVCVGLLLIPNGSELGTYLGDYDTCYSNVSLGDYYTHDVEPPSDPLENCSQKYWTILLTLIGTVLVDFSADSGQSPARTYLCDVTPKSDHARGMSTFSLMAGIGGCLGYLIGAIDWPQTALGAMLGGQIDAVFTIVLISFIVCVLYTITSFAELPLERRFATPSTTAIATPARNTPSRSTPPRPADTSSPMPWMYFPWRIVFDDSFEMRNLSTSTTVTAAVAASGTATVAVSPVAPAAEPIVAAPAPLPTATISTSSGSEAGYIRNDEFIVNATPSPNDSQQSDYDEMPVPTLKTYLNSIITMPPSLRILCLTNLFCWMSHVCYSLYFTDYVAQAVFGGDPNAEPNTLDQKLYNDGVRYGCWGLAIYSASCSIYALFIDRLIEKVGCKNVYVYSLLMYGIGMLFMFFLNDKVSVLIFSGTAGVMYATLFTLPYFLVTYYHQKNMFGCSRQVRGLGTDMAVTHSMVFLAQLILSLGMGFIIKLLGSTSAIVLVSSILSFCAAGAATKVSYLDL